MKLEKVPCIYADDLTEEQIRAFRIADNKTGEAASWDWSILPEELKGIKTIDMTAFGFLNTEVEDPDDVHEDNYNPEGAKRRTEAGQLWELGEHRLMIGDSTDPAAVKNLMGGSWQNLFSRIRRTASRSETKTRPSIRSDTAGGSRKTSSEIRWESMIYIKCSSRRSGTSEKYARKTRPIMFRVRRAAKSA